MMKLLAPLILFLCVSFKTSAMVPIEATPAAAFERERIIESYEGQRSEFGRQRQEAHDETKRRMAMDYELYSQVSSGLPSEPISTSLPKTATQKPVGGFHMSLPSQIAWVALLFLLTIMIHRIFARLRPRSGD